jgi:superfamily I DNA/RNA helicase
LAPSFAFVKGKLKPQKRDGWDAPLVNLLPQTSGDCHKTAGIQVQTVHGVKGETHDITIFVCPPMTAAHCPSTVWWSTSDKDREEKRIAYVAMTRTRGDLIFCVSQACYDRLAARHVAFVESFECMTVADCVLSLGQTTLANTPVAVK